ncbi:MAG: hypothetical protein E7370_01865 [Clostridiales bacterium]|nr:hypothetical protein [Clostridiales bacterium]
MKNKKIKAIALSVLLAFSSFVAGCNGCNPNTNYEKNYTSYGNVQSTHKVEEASLDVSINVVAKKTSGTRGKNLIASGIDEVEVNGLQAGNLIYLQSDYCWIKVNLCEALGTALVYSPTGEFVFEVPSNLANYDSQAFASATKIQASVATEEEISANRNLAVNPYDFMYSLEKNDPSLSQAPVDSVSVEEGEVCVYPHAYANRVTRNEAGFYARNAIDGLVESQGHGNFPYQSWGYDQKADAEFIVYFGREVSLNKLAFVLRADYSGSPEHDTYWESVTAQFSDGTEQQISLNKSGDKQEVEIDEVKTSFVRIKNIVAKQNGNSQMYAALTELEAYGSEIGGKNTVATKTYVTPTFGGKQSSGQKTAEFYAQDIADTMKIANDWFMQNDGKLVIPTYNGAQETLYVNSNDWRDSVYYTGLLDYYMTTGDEEAYYYLSGVAEQFDYLVNGDYRTPHGDHYLIGEVFLQLNDLYGADNFKIKSAVDNAEYNIARDPEDSRPVTSTNSYATDGSRDWSHMAFWWCDALYMSMNTYTLLSRQTGDAKYVEAAYEGYMHWKEILYNKTYHLWHRDTTQFNVYTNLTDEDGNKVPTFWARGNAWVHAALAKQLLYLEEERYPEIYEQYKNDFIEISEALAQYQDEETGTWPASIVDGTYYGGREVTGTSGFMYAFAVGIELGILDFDEYFPIVAKAYDGIVNCMLTDDNGEWTGQLGYMQTVGYQPANYDSENYSRNITNEFGMGLFLMGSSALMRICEDFTAPELVIPSDPQSVVKKVANPFVEDGGDEEEVDYYTGDFTVTASGYQNDNSGYNPPSALFDGDDSGSDGKRWAVSSFPNKAWVQADFGETVTINKVAVAPNSGRDYRYIIEVSTDGTNWTTVVDRSNNTESSALLTDSFNAVQARYIKITLNGAATYTGTWYNINELFIYTV